MIRFTDAFILARTKLRTHRIRTGLTVGISGVLFGLLIAVVCVVQGVFESVDRFSDEGLNGRYVVTINSTPSSLFDLYSHLEDQEFIKRVEVVHTATIAKKKAAAKKYNIEYSAATEDPSPILIDPVTKAKRFDDTKVYQSPAVLEVAEQIAEETREPFSLTEFLKPYKTATVIDKQEELSPLMGNALVYMKEGKENFNVEKKRIEAETLADINSGVTILPQTLAKPFVTNTKFDPSKGEIPAIIPYVAAEKLLKLKPLEKTAPDAEKLERIQEVRRRVSEITASLCYRNTASQSLLSLAIASDKEIAANKNNPDFVKPSVIYNIPQDTECGAVTVKSDTRTPVEKQADENRKKYEQEIGTYVGDPTQYKITMRGVGVSSSYGDQMGSGTSSIAELVQNLFGASLGIGTWTVPEDLFKKVPVEARPAAVFSPEKPEQGSFESFGFESYLVEFTDKEEARKLLRETGMFGGSTGSVYVSPFGSASLILDEMRSWFETGLYWTVLVISLVAMIILGGMIGRTIGDSRRESAVFRAIGARRIDITMIYVTYTFLLSLRIILFAAILGLVIAGVTDLLVYKDATIGAHLAFGALHPEKEFHLIGIMSWYVPAILGVIIAVGFIAMIIPLLRNVRRNPINDMRDE